METKKSRNRNVKIIAIAGGTASGKTTIANKLFDLSKLFGKVNMIKLDNYYLDRSMISFEDREKINYDHPNSFDIELLVKHIKDLKENKSIRMPIYNFKTHTREEKTILVEPSRVIIIEGIMILAIMELQIYFDIKIFVETPDDLRFIRRLQRDIKERSRSIESVIEQYLAFVRPMHELFVEPSRMNADIIVPEGGFNNVAIDIINNTIIRMLSDT